MKLCRDCSYFIYDEDGKGGPKCGYAIKRGLRKVECSRERLTGACGPSGQFFEVRPPSAMQDLAELGRAWDNLWFEILKALHIPQIAEWIKGKLRGKA